MLRRDANDLMHTLTTPVCYITSYFADPFAPKPGEPFSYWVPGTGAGYIMWSPGPDGAYDLNLNNIANVYKGPNTGFQDPLPGLIELTYDPTNGTLSRGDIWRIKQ